MHKFFVSNDCINKNNIFITGDDVSHISKVLRLRTGDKVQISNGNGKEYICAIEDISKKEVTCGILESYENSTEPPLEITLFQGIPKSQKMDLIIQKCVEIGVVNFWPVITERVVVKVEDRDIKSKLERWNRISVEAAKQSNRGIVPAVNDPITFEEAIKLMKAMDLSIIPYENEKDNNLRQTLGNRSVKTLGIFIGPEGGFESSEIKSCIDNNILPITLGPRILRTETAGFVTATIAQYELGDMGGNISK